MLYLHHRSRNYAGTVYHPIPLFYWGKFTCLCFASFKFIQKRGIYNTKAVGTSENERVTQTTTNDDHPCPATVVFLNSSGYAASGMWRTGYMIFNVCHYKVPWSLQRFSFFFLLLIAIQYCMSWLLTTYVIQYASSFSKESVQLLNPYWMKPTGPGVFIVATRPCGGHAGKTVTLALCLP